VELATPSGTVSMTKLSSVSNESSGGTLAPLVIYDHSVLQPANESADIAVILPADLVQGLLTEGSAIASTLPLSQEAIDALPDDGDGQTKVRLSSLALDFSIILEQSGKVRMANATDLTTPILLRLGDAPLPEDVCAFFDPVTRRWSTEGLSWAADPPSSGAWCASTHLSIFATVQVVVPFDDVLAPQEETSAAAVAAAVIAAWCGAPVASVLRLMCLAWLRME